ncbi:MAG: SDR family NAD(P)-dependent oxidoreductase [Shimia sp.]
MAVRVAVVTGAAGGLGRAICAALAPDHHVIGMDLRPSETAEPIEIDLTDADAIAEAFAGIGARHGRLDVLVNNAGTCFMSDFPEIPVAEFEAQMRVNFHSMFHCCQAAVPLMLGGDGVRKIVNISSNGAYNFDVFDPPHYRASKAAMDTMTKDLARRYATERIAVNSIAPAMTETPLFGVLDDATLAKALAAMPHGVAMRPEQVAGWVAHLAGPLGDVCSGNVIVLNQGRDVR